MGKSRAGRRKTGFRLGLTLFILAAAVLAGLAAMHFVNQGLGLRYSYVFEDANGLAPGHPVTLSGYPVGEVTGVSLDPESRIRVDVRIEQEYAKQVSADHTALIEAPNRVDLAGRRVVRIVNSTGDEAKPIRGGAEIEGVENGLELEVWKLRDRVDGLGGDAADAARSVADRIEVLAEEFQDIPESPEYKAAMEQITQSFDSLVESGGEQWTTIKEEMSDLNERFGPMMDEARQHGGEALSDALNRVQQAIDSAKMRLSENRIEVSEEPAPSTSADGSESLE